MDNSLLRKGCELAGMVEAPSGEITGADVWLTADDSWLFASDNPALHSYVASLLVAKVREGDTTIRQYFYDELEAILAAISLSLDMETATDEQRIRAAISVLSSHHHAGNPMSRDGGP